MFHLVTAVREFERPISLQYYQQVPQGKVRYELCFRCHNV